MIPQAQTVLTRLSAFAKGFRFRSLSEGIVIAMCAGLLLPALIGGVVLTNMRQDDLRKEIKNDIRGKVNLLTHSLVDPLWNLDQKLLQTIATAVLLDPQAVRVTIFDQDLKPVLSLERPERRIGMPHVASGPLVHRGTLLGSVEMEIYDGLRQRELAQDRRAYSFLLLGQFVVALVLILLAIRVRVLKPLARLTAFSDQLAGGNLSQPLEWHQPDEIGRLAIQMDHMRQGLKTSFAEQQAILNSIQVGVLFVRDRTIQLANRHAEQIFGYEPGAMHGLSTRALYLTDTQFSAIGDQAYEAIRTATSQFESELRLKRFDGSTFLARMHGSALDRDTMLGGSLWVCEDITEKKRAEAAYSYSVSLTNAALESTVDGILVVDRSGKISRWNQKFVDLWRVPKELLVTDVDDPVLKYVTDQMAQPEAFSARVQELMEHPEASSDDTLLLSDGRVIERYSQPQKIGKDIVGRFWSFRDITERRHSEAKLQLAASVFSHAREGIMITAADGTIIDVNETFVHITGFSRDEVLGKTPGILKSGHQEKNFYVSMWRDLIDKCHWQGEIWNRRKNGEIYAELLSISAVQDQHGCTQHYVALFSDITALKQHEKQLEHIAHYDVLTGLPNRVLLADRLHQAMVQTQRRNQLLAVAFLDLDGFKLINDRHGHGTGDRVLVTLANRMQLTLRESDTLARIGGDEFVAVLLDLNVADGISMVDRLLAEAAKPMLVGDLELQVSASLGVTFYPQTQNIDAEQLLRQADQAMYQAKLAGKNRYHVFDAKQDSSIRGHHESLERVRVALTQKEFVLHYQPKVNMRTGKVIGAEALIRWQHPEKGLLAPAAFLPVIEDHPLAVEVGEWVIDTALNQIERWHVSGLDLPQVSVNVGAPQLQQSDFAERLRIILARHPQVDPTRLDLEILETSALQDIAQVSQVIEDCAQIGVRFALDDFGTGYSSLTYLKRLRVSMLKIDQSFVRDMLEDPEDLAILEGVIGLAAAFKRQVIAEGVETVAHGTALLRLGCDLAQGYGIARPMPGADMPAWVAAWRPDTAWYEMKPFGEDQTQGTEP